MTCRLAAGLPAPETEWLILAYMAGDNNLEGELLGDLAEMERVGSQPGQVEILAEVDRSPGQDTSKGNWHGARRYYVLKGADPRRRASRLIADLGETNTGDPRVLEDFIAFGARNLPARRTALILSGHGSGMYTPPEMDSARRGPSSPHRRHRRPFFHATRGPLRDTAPRTRGIAYDDTSGDCLDMLELKRVLARAHRILGRKVDLVGMDACLMTMLEVAYQIRDHARVLVGSEEVEPGAGWPYATILGDLGAKPTIGPEELGATIVRRYIESYEGTDLDATQSAIDLDQLDDLVEVVDALALALLAGLRSTGMVAALRLAWHRTLRFFDDASVDLHHFATELARATDRRRIRRACKDLLRAVEGRAARSPLVAEAHTGPRVEPACGVSIHFPAFRNPAFHYRELDFARRTRWADVMDASLGRAI